MNQTFVILNPIVYTKNGPNTLEGHEVVVKVMKHQRSVLTQMLFPRCGSLELTLYLMLKFVSWLLLVLHRMYWLWQLRARNLISEAL